MCPVLRAFLLAECGVSYENEVVSVLYVSVALVGADMRVLGPHGPVAAAAVPPNAAAAYNEWIHRMYRIRTPHTHSFQQGMAMLAVKSYVGWAEWVSPGRQMPPTVPATAF